MPGAVRKHQDRAVGQLVSGAESVIVNGDPIVRLGDLVQSHAPWGPPHPPHAAATMVSASSTVYAEGKLVCRAGDIASCGHAATGSNNVIVG